MSETLLTWVKTVTPSSSAMVYWLRADQNEKIGYELRVLFDYAHYYWALKKIHRRSLWNNGQAVGDWYETVHQSRQIALNGESHQEVIDQVIEEVEQMLFSPMQRLDIRLDEAKT